MLIFRVLLIGLMAALPSQRTAADPCAKLPVHPVPHTAFPLTLTPFGNVCFAAHIIANPAANAAPDENAAVLAAEPYFALSLFKTGKDVYDFSAPDDLWNASIDRIVSVAFRKLNHDRFTDVIVIGHQYAANAADIYQPLIFRGNGTGFTLDDDLSEGLANNGYATMPALIAAIDSGIRPRL